MVRWIVDRISFKAAWISVVGATADVVIVGASDGMARAGELPKVECNWAAIVAGTALSQLGMGLCSSGGAGFL